MYAWKQARQGVSVFYKRYGSIHAVKSLDKSSLTSPNPLDMRILERMSKSEDLSI